MLKLRPIVVDENNTILGGNMRYKACQDLNFKEVYIVKADDLTEQQKQEFIIKDNVGFGEWDWDILANVWDNTQLKDWGMDVWQPEEDIDYSILDDEDFEKELDGMEGNIRKALQIPFEADNYEEAKDLYKFWVDRGAYVGGMIIELLKSEKEKL